MLSIMLASENICNTVVLANKGLLKLDIQSNFGDTLSHEKQCLIYHGLRVR